ncbi:3-oxoacyl-[acyl-carrier-protein] synthase III C-terminal domain-containing protein [Herbidospora mongoliensis]|uniref:3-oxoacyl-[acyl-carrier-protein] synthase III C-terminal domain-containing protein n=1 Tax=Herbidospora mongoliensis TaxID=688067 RepID=UPI00082D7ECA|nr:3-oxoacyl-[acyl-carrier-protein] synthase III C-terminal domain-containing protein [Herbidospora mongoliensis]
MVRTVIDSLGVASPSRIVATRDVVDGCLRPLDLPLELTTGIVSRRVAGEGEYSVDLAARAGLDCLSRSSIPAGEVDLLINTSISRVDGPSWATYEPALATRLRRLLGCHDAWTFDLANACAGTFTGIWLADALIRAGRIRTALVVSGEFVSHMIPTAQLEIEGKNDPRIACLTLGDAGAAVLLTRSDDDRAGFRHIGLRTIGEHHTLCVAGPSDQPHGGAVMKTQMATLAAICIRESIAHAAESLAAIDLPIGDIDRFIPHQMSSLAIRAGIRQANRAFGAKVLDKGNVIDNLATRGNTSTTAHLVALHDASHDGRVESGQRVLFEIAASGVTVGTAVYTLDDLPDRLAEGRKSDRPTPPATPAPLRGVRIGAVGLATEGATTVELLREAVTDCLAGREQPDLLIHTGVYVTGLIAEPAVAATAAGELGLGGDFLGFDLTNGGLGTLDACRVAAELISAGTVNTVLVVASEDGGGVARRGSALLLEAGEGGFAGFHSRHFDEQLADFYAGAVQEDGRSFARAGDRELLADRTAALVPQVVAELLAAHGVTEEEISAVLMPDIELFTSALPFAFATLEAAPGDLVVIVGAASGIEIGAALYRM